MRVQKRRGRWWAAGLALASVMGSVPALAQSKAAPTAAQGAPSAADREKEAARLYEEGVNAAKAGQWEKARGLMLKSFDLKPSVQKAANLGKVELTAGKPRDGAEHLTFFLRDVKGIQPEDREAAEKLLAEAKAKIGTVTIQVEAGAEVLVDGESVGSAPLEGPIFVDPGTWRFEAKKEGAGSASQQVQVAAGSAPVVELKLTNVEIAGPDVAKVGTGAEMGPVPGIGAPTSIRRVVEVPPAAGGPRNQTLMYAGIGVSAGLAVVGIGTAIGAVVKSAASQNEIDQAGGKDGCRKDESCRNHHNELQKQWSPLATLAAYSFIGAAVIGTGTAVYTLTRSKSGEQVQVSMALTPQGGGATLRFSW